MSLLGAVGAPGNDRQRNRGGSGGCGGKPGLPPGAEPNVVASSGFFKRLERKASPRGEGGTGGGIAGACGGAGCNGGAASNGAL